MPRFTFRKRPAAQGPGAEAVLPFSFFVFFTVASFALYRYFAWTIVSERFSLLRGLSFSEYISLAFIPDIIMVSLAALLYLLIFTLFNKRPLARDITASAYTLFQTELLLMAGVFFRVYETTFQSSFFNDEIKSGFGDVASSFFAEAGSGFYAGSAVSLFVLTAASLHIRKIRQRYPAAILLAFTAVLLSAPLVLKAIHYPLSGTLSKRYSSLQPEILKASLTEITSNPLLNLITPSPAQNSARSAEKTENKLQSDIATGKYSSLSIEENNYIPSAWKHPKGKKYNIILFFFESTPAKYLDMKVNGKFVMPAFRRLARNSLAMKRHYTNSPLSANAMLNVLASAHERMDSRELVIQRNPDIGLKTAPEILGENGYSTCVIHTGDLRYAGQRRFLAGRGFDRIIEYDDLKNIPPHNKKVGWGLDERSMIKPAVDFIRQSGSNPFFLVMLPVNPHHPYAIPDNSFRITGEIPGSLSAREKSKMNYLNSLHYADYALGEFADTLEAQGLMDDTLLLVFADHGEAFYEHRGNYNHPFYLYEENVNVPFIIYNKKLFPEPVENKSLTSHIDILPTILDIVGAPAHPAHEGRSIASSGPARLALLHTFWKDDITSIRDGEWKYIIRSRDSYEELYNLAKDPGEKNNLALVNREKAMTFRSRIESARLHNSEFYRKAGVKKRSKAASRD